MLLDRLPEQSSGSMVLSDLVPSWIRHPHRFTQNSRVHQWTFGFQRVKTEMRSPMENEKLDVTMHSKYYFYGD
ncbi:hypothetical protein TNCV_2109871 [Trichonephila clavipes]|nr:hypothetical protein TNCV_2109871 [Trichonephila clavipes]